MKGPSHASRALEADMIRLERERLVVLCLDDLDGLLNEPAVNAFVPRTGPARAGIDDLALTRCAEKLNGAVRRRARTKRDVRHCTSSDAS